MVTGNWLSDVLASGGTGDEQILQAILLKSIIQAKAFAQESRGSAAWMRGPPHGHTGDSDTDRGAPRG